VSKPGAAVSKPGPAVSKPGPGRGQARPERRVAPRWLDPVMTLAESIDRRRRHITPLRPEGVLGLELGRHGGQPIRLADGCDVSPGDQVGCLHFRNDRVRALAGRGWQAAGFAEARADLEALARWWLAQPAETRPVAFVGVTILGPLMRREGWEVRPRRATRRARLDEWWMRWLMVHFGIQGRARLRQGHRALTSAEVWLSGTALAERYGPASAGVGPG
jgi:hypothetical protein